MSLPITNKKSLSLLDLNEDIISFYLVKHLSERDIQSLFLTCKSLYLILNESIVWHSLFTKSFHSDNIPSFSIHYKWPKLYKFRKHCKLLTWGSNEFSRLGYSNIPNANFENPENRGRPMFLRRMLKPLTIEFGTTDGSVNKNIFDLTAGGFSFCILTSDGELMYTGRSWHGNLGITEPGPKTEDYRLNGVRLVSAEGNGRCIFPVVTGGIHEDVKFQEVGSGRSHFIGLDQYNRVWTWDANSQNRFGILLNLVDHRGNSIVSRDNYIERIRAGWRLSTCLVKNVGIVVWKFRDALTSRDGIFGPVNATVLVAVGTESIDDIVDYIVLDNYIVYLMKNGMIHKVDFGNANFETDSILRKTTKLEKFTRYIHQHSKQSTVTVKFIRISGSFNKFSAISNDDQVLLGQSNGDDPIVIKQLQHKSIISVAVGDHHFLALDKSGQMYSWGKELRTNGCIGIGSLNSIVSNGLGRLDGHTLTVDVPQKYDVGGKVLAIAAGGWQSAALVYFGNDVLEE